MTRAARNLTLMAMTFALLAVFAFGPARNIAICSAAGARADAQHLAAVSHISGTVGAINREAR